MAGERAGPGPPGLKPAAPPLRRTRIGNSLLDEAFGGVDKVLPGRVLFGLIDGRYILFELRELVSQLLLVGYELAKVEPGPLNRLADGDVLGGVVVAGVDLVWMIQ